MLPKPPSTPPRHLPGTGRWLGALGRPGLSPTVPLEQGSPGDQHSLGISIPWGSAPGLCRAWIPLQLPRAQWTPLWCIVWGVDAELPSGCATSPSGHCPNPKVSRVAWAKPWPCRSSSAVWGHVWPPLCTGDTDPEGSPGQGTAWPWVSCAKPQSQGTELPAGTALPLGHPGQSGLPCPDAPMPRSILI